MHLPNFLLFGNYRLLTKSRKTYLLQELQISKKGIIFRIDMKKITVPIDLPSDLLIILNESGQELKDHLQLTIALSLYQEGKLTLGKAIQVSGLTRYDFEKVLAKRKIPISNLSFEQVFSDVEKLKSL